MGREAKGIFEQGFINPERMTEYTVNGRNDVFGNHVADTSLRYLMEQLSDFQNEGKHYCNTRGDKWGAR